MAGRVDEEKDPRLSLGGDEELVEGGSEGIEGNGSSVSSGMAGHVSAIGHHTSVAHSRGPELGVLPSRSALAPSAAFHLAYCSFCSI
jgi:hypothetical protein